MLQNNSKMHTEMQSTQNNEDNLGGKKAGGQTTVIKIVCHQHKDRPIEQTNKKPPETDSHIQLLDL